MLNNGVGSSTGIHFHTVNNIVVSNSEFYPTKNVGIALHGISQNVSIIDNIFLPAWGSDSGYICVGVGHWFAPGSIDGCNILRNEFYGPLGGNGILIGTPYNNGIIGFCANLKISDNYFNFLEKAIGVYNYLQEDLYALISNNKFDDCDVSIHLDNNNSNTNIFCNWFRFGDVGLLLTDLSGVAVTKDWLNFDHNNWFQNIALCIDNQSPNFFTYFESSANPYPVNSTNGLVHGIGTHEMTICSKKTSDDESARDKSANINQQYKTTLNHDVGFEVYPNPTKGTMFINVKNGDLNTFVVLTDSHGREVLRTNSNRSIFELNIENCAPGVYFLSVNNKFGSSVNKIIKE